MTKFLDKLTLGEGNINKIVKSRFFGRALTVLQIVFFTSVCATSVGLASADFSTLTTLIVTWTTRVGGVVAFVGAIMFALGWRNDDPGEMIKGAKTCIAGIMIVAISQGSGAWLS
ncbi:hypothetical protein [Clostridium akagii]|uniref:hypothetical protein n=1 Tax=Clostridium akagii TaxID=91623 RepID=UPI00055F0915|nr:hypothetical protein [Clostridium akagii]